MESPSTHCRVKPNCIIEEGCDGAIIWVTPSRARLLADAGAVDLIGEQPEIGPSETKPAGPSEKKSYPAATDSPSTDLASSTESGKAGQSSSSAVAQALAMGKSMLSKRPGAPKKST